LRLGPWAAAAAVLHCTADGKPIPSELRKDEPKLRKEVELEDDNTAVRKVQRQPTMHAPVHACPLLCPWHGAGATHACG
jgi:hypothetical protein